MSLTVRQQNQFIAALDNLRTSDRVHKGDLQTVNKMLNKMGGVANSKEILSTALKGKEDKFNIKDSTQIKSFLDGLQTKLNEQNSKIFYKKCFQLNSIGDRLYPASQKIEADHFNKEIKLNMSEAKQQLENSAADKRLIHNTLEQKNINNELISINKHKLNRITIKDIIEHQDKRIDALKDKTQSQIDRLKVDAYRINKRGPALIQFLQENKKDDVLHDLAKARTDSKLRDKMATSQYAESKFGTKTVLVEGRHSYSAMIKKEELSDDGRAFLNRMKKYNTSRLDLAIVDNAIKTLESDMAAEIKAIKTEKRSPLQLKYDLKIEKYQNDNKTNASTGVNALTSLSSQITVIDNAIANATALNEAIAQNATAMADPEVQKTVALNKQDILNMARERAELNKSLNRLIDAATTGKNYYSDDSESSSDSDISSDSVSSSASFMSIDNESTI